jgi:hypothetical protein
MLPDHVGCPHSAATMCRAEALESCMPVWRSRRCCRWMAESRYQGRCVIPAIRCRFSRNVSYPRGLSHGPPHVVNRPPLNWAVIPGTNAADATSIGTRAQANGSRPNRGYIHPGSCRIAALISGVKVERQTLNPLPQKSFTPCCANPSLTPFLRLTGANTGYA